MGEISSIQSRFIQYINGIIHNHRVSHAYLIELNNYEQDLTFVYSFIKMILCNISYEELESCQNPILTLIDDGNYPDIRVISSDTGVIQKSFITDLQKEYSNKSLLNGKRIYLIREAEKLNGFSANTILKFLEEPEDDIIAFLLTDNRYHVLDTILSRCQVLSLKEEKGSYQVDDSLLDILDCILNPRQFFLKYRSYMDDIFLDKNVMRNQLREVENVLIAYLEGNLIEKDELSFLSSKTSDEVIHILSVIEDEVPKLDFNVNFKLWVDALFSRLIGG